MNIELRHLRYFVAVAEDLHFAKAAKRLSISQPPLSQQILALEREIGARLFERSNRRVELTDAGRVFLKEATEILGKVDNAAVVAERIHRGQLGEIRVGFVSSAPCVDEFQQLVFEFRKQHREPKAQTATWLVKRMDDRSPLPRQFFQAALRYNPATVQRDLRPPARKRGRTYTRGDVS